MSGELILLLMGTIVPVLVILLGVALLAGPFGRERRWFPQGVIATGLIGLTAAGGLAIVADFSADAQAAIGIMFAVLLVNAGTFLLAGVYTLVALAWIDGRRQPPRGFDVVHQAPADQSNP